MTFKSQSLTPPPCVVCRECFTSDWQLPHRKSTGHNTGKGPTKVNFDFHVLLALTKHQLKCILSNKKWYIYQFLCINWWTCFTLGCERILGWVGVVRKFLSLKELKNPYAKMDHPLPNLLIYPWPRVLSLPGRFVGDPASLARDNM